MQEAGKIVYSAKESQKVIADNESFFYKAINDNTFSAYVALDGVKIIAGGGATFFNIPPSFSAPSGKVAYLANMYTYPEYRKKGLGTEILKLIVEEAKIRDCKKIILYASDAGEKMYERFGFKVDKRDMVFYLK